jgi:hypothetical protein
MGDRLDYTAQDIAQSLFYSPGARPIDKSVRDTMDAERKFIDAAFTALEQGTFAPIIKDIDRDNTGISAGTPGVLIVLGANFGTDNSKVSLEVGTETPVVAESANFSATRADFNLGALSLTAGHIVNITVIFTDSATKSVRSLPMAVPVKA